MILHVIDSGSRANSYVLKSEGVGGASLILEAGVKWSSVLGVLDYNIGRLSGCLVTHEHGDHARHAAEYCTKHRVRLYASSGTLSALGISGEGFTHPVEKNRKYALGGGFSVIPFGTYHDATEPFGYLIHHPEMGTLLFATDTYLVKPQFKALNHILLECNYSEEILYRRAWEDESVSLRLKRLRESHLSLETALKTLERNDLTKVQEIVLIHLSWDNSDAEQFKTAVQRATGIPTYIAESGLKIRLNRI